jgi:hypothetical protein
MVTSVRSGLTCGNPSMSHHRDDLGRSRAVQILAPKRFLSADHVTDIVQRYEAGETTHQVGKRYGISKTRVATVLRDQGVTIRRQGLNDEQIAEAGKLYAVGYSLAWLGTRFGVSHTTIATALRRQAIQLRPRPGWR